MDFEPAQGGWVAGEGSGGELGRGDGVVGGEQGVVVGLDAKVGDTGHARTGSREVLFLRGGGGCVGSGSLWGGGRGRGEVFLVIDELAFGVDERAGPDQLGQCEAQQPCGLFQKLGFGHGEFLERIHLGALEEALRGCLVKDRGQTRQRLPRACCWFGPSGFRAHT